MTDTTPSATGADPGPIPDSLKREPPPPKGKWDQLQFHSLSQLFPPMDDGELNNLAEDIKQNGLMEPITLKDGQILDGQNRYRACRRAGWVFKDEDFIELAAGIDPLLFVISKNIQRRHLTADQKWKIIELLLKQNPSASSRHIAGIAKVSHHTVENVRQSTGQSAQLRTGADGKSRKSPKGKRGGSSAKQQQKHIKTFIASWEGFDGWQKRSFVKQYRDELEELLQEVDNEDEVPDAAE